jgi:hypothetical protein
LRVVLTPHAEQQLAPCPSPPQEGSFEALRALQVAPRSGQPYPDDSPFRGSYHKTVVVRARRWAYRLTYTLRDGALWVRYLYPSWYPLTHPALAQRDDE